MLKSIITSGCLISMLFCMALASFGVEPYGPADAQLTMVVMDPLAAPLACECVKGYAQRKYESLADYLRESTGMTVRVVWSESLPGALEKQAKSIQIVIGKDSVVRADAKRSNLDLRPLVQLTDKKGSVKQKGLFVVLRDSPVATLLDLDGFDLLIGPSDCDEKDFAPRKKLNEMDVDYQIGEVCSSCSTAAKMLMETQPNKRVAAVISSYAAPLLEGCGTINKGDLKVIGESDPVPFISAFVDSSLSEEAVEQISTALLNMNRSPSMLTDMETSNGFVPYALSDEEIELEKKKGARRP